MYQYPDYLMHYGVPGMKWVLENTLIVKGSLLLKVDDTFLIIRRKNLLAKKLIPRATN